MTILITGATGFIGKYLCLTLLQQGHDVKALTRSKSSLTQLTGFLEQQGVAMERFSALEGDLAGRSAGHALNLKREAVGRVVAIVPDAVELPVHRTDLQHGDFQNGRLGQRRSGGEEAAQRGGQEGSDAGHDDAPCDVVVQPEVAWPEGQEDCTDKSRFIIHRLRV